MTAESDDDILDSLFHGCALAAYIDTGFVLGTYTGDAMAAFAA